MPDSSLAQKIAVHETKKPVPWAVLQRQCACGQHSDGGECTACKKNRETKNNHRSAVISQPEGEVPSSVYRAISTPGQQLDHHTQAALQPRYPYDLSTVRVHTGPEAAKASRAVNAQAFTTGRDIVFNQGRYAPGTSTGKTLLAHELTHAAAASPTAQPNPGKLSMDPQRSSVQEAAARRVESGAALSHRDAAQLRGSGVGLIHRQEDAGTDQSHFNGALSRYDYDEAVTYLSRMSDADIRVLVEPLSEPAREKLRDAALNLPPDKRDRVAGAIEAVAQKAPATTTSQKTTSTAQSTQPAQQAQADIGSLTAAQKLYKAWEYAGPELGPAAVAELKNLFSLQSLAMMAVFAGLYIASQLTPVGWVADAIALVTLTISILFVGKLLIDIAKDLYTFFSAVKATTDAELHESGKALARAVAKGGIALVIELLTRSVRSGGKGGGAAEEGAAVERAGSEGGTKTVEADAYAPGVGTVKVQVQVQSNAAVGVQVPTRLQAATATYTVFVQPPTNLLSTGSGGGGGGGGNKPPESSGSGSKDTGEPNQSKPPRLASPAKGEEIWDEVSQDLSLEPPGTGGSGSSVASAVKDAKAAGLTGSNGQPGTVDAAFQSHSSASTVRGAKGVTGAQEQSAHVGATSFLRGQKGYSRGAAETILLDPATHAGFDSYWKNWAQNQRRAGRTTCSVNEMYNVMLDAINQIPNITQTVKNVLAMKLQQEIFSQLGLNPTQQIPLPYPNIPPKP